MPSTNNTGSAPRAKCWCFTLNNYTPEQVAYLTNEDDPLNEIHEKAEFLVFQHEIGSNGTPHLQGAMCFLKQLRFNKVKDMLPTVHLEVMKSTPAQSHVYCTKDSTRQPGMEPYIWGDIPINNSGQCNDLEAFKDDVKAGVTDLVQLREDHSEVLARYGNGFCKNYIADHRPRRPAKLLTEFYPWEIAMNTHLDIDPMMESYDRQILFIWENIGNS